MKCTKCGKYISDDQAYWAFDKPYCEKCYEESSKNCHICDVFLNMEDIFYDLTGYPLCSQCYAEKYEDAPNNPIVYDSDRKLILSLSRNWLYKEVT